MVKLGQTILTHASPRSTGACAILTTACNAWRRVAVPTIRVSIEGSRAMHSMIGKGTGSYRPAVRCSPTWTGPLPEQKPRGSFGRPHGCNETETSPPDQDYRHIGGKWAGLSLKPACLSESTAHTGSNMDFVSRWVQLGTTPARPRLSPGSGSPRQLVNVRGQLSQSRLLEAFQDRHVQPVDTV